MGFLSKGPLLLVLAWIVSTSVCTRADGVNLSIASDPYLTGGLFVSPALPQEEQTVVVTVRAYCAGGPPTGVKAKVAVLDSRDSEVTSETIPLEVKNGGLEGRWEWKAGKNGLYRVDVLLDPENKVDGDSELDNSAEILLPVLIKGRPLHFAWYSEPENARWVTCVTSSDEKNQPRLRERGIMPLNWEYGGMSWSYYDKDKASTDPESVLAELEELFLRKYARDGDIQGFGIDECGGYAGTWAHKASIASMKGLVRARREKPGRFFAVWNGGGLNPELAALYRQGVDLLLLETYLWRALPDELGAEDIYQVIVDRIEPTVRSSDMFRPAYGNHCHTLIALDTSERPDRCDLGEQENVVRFIRQRFPEMRGIAWYNGGYGNKSYGMERNEENDRQHRAVLDNADHLCLKYFVEPCLTFLQEALWLSSDVDGGHILNAAVSNIGAIDSGEVSVEFLLDGMPLDVQKAEKVPAGPNRNENRAIFKQPIFPEPGPHTATARITSAPNATVLECKISKEVFIQP